MDVRICGPNLNSAAQRKGSFHVHEASCNDLNYYGPGRKYGGDMLGTREMLVRQATVTSIVEAVYDNGIIDERLADDMIGETREDVVDSLAPDFWFAPCCARVES